MFRSTQLKTEPNALIVKNLYTQTCDVILDFNLDAKPTMGV